MDSENNLDFEEVNQKTSEIRKIVQQKMTKNKITFALKKSDAKMINWFSLGLNSLSKSLKISEDFVAMEKSIRREINKAEGEEYANIRGKQNSMFIQLQKRENPVISNKLTGFNKKGDETALIKGFFYYFIILRLVKP